MTGLTQEQRSRLDERDCQGGHRFDGVNFPTPEGTCPLCEWPEVRDEINRYQRVIAEYTVQRQTLALHVQHASPSLTAFSER